MKKAGNRRKSGSLLSLSMAAVLLLSPLGGLASTAGAGGTWQGSTPQATVAGRRLSTRGGAAQQADRRGGLRALERGGRPSLRHRRQKHQRVRQEPPQPVYSGSGSSGGTPDNTVGILDSLKAPASASTQCWRVLQRRGGLRPGPAFHGFQPLQLPLPLFPHG